MIVAASGAILRKGPDAECGSYYACPLTIDTFQFPQMLAGLGADTELRIAHTRLLADECLSHAIRC